MKRYWDIFLENFAMGPRFITLKRNIPRTLDELRPVRNHLACRVQNSRGKGVSMDEFDRVFDAFLAAEEKLVEREVMSSVVGVKYRVNRRDIAVLLGHVEELLGMGVIAEDVAQRYMRLFDPGIVAHPTRQPGKDKGRRRAKK